jgi:hypothetical protein
MELIDPEGEGIYLLDVNIGVLRRAALIFHGNASAWREIDQETVWMEPNPLSREGEWRRANTGRFPRYWRLNLPRRWRPIAYVYCTPKPDPPGEGEDEMTKRQLKKRIEAMRDALIWCSGASDFDYPDGKARKGWEKVVRPLLDKGAK